jgi:hypothetical protein
MDVANATNDDVDSDNEKSPSNEETKDDYNDANTSRNEPQTIPDEIDEIVG